VAAEFGASGWVDFGNLGLARFGGLFWPTLWDIEVGGLCSAGA
jgi:hypothetical protein